MDNGLNHRTLSMLTQNTTGSIYTAIWQSADKCSKYGWLVIHEIMQCSTALYLYILARMFRPTSETCKSSRGDFWHFGRKPAILDEWRERNQDETKHSRGYPSHSNPPPSSASFRLDLCFPINLPDLPDVRNFQDKMNIRVGLLLRSSKEKFAGMMPSLK